MLFSTSIEGADVAGKLSIKLPSNSILLNEGPATTEKLVSIRPEPTL